MTEQDSWHPEAFLQNRYTRAYRKLVEWAKTQKRPKRGHAEHHIVPRSFYRSHRDDGWLDGNPDDPSNLVILTHREHAWCHVLLALRMTDGLAKLKMSVAPKWMLSWLRKRGLNHRFCTRVLQSLDSNRVESIRQLAKKRWAENTEWRNSITQTMIAMRNTPEWKAFASATTKAYMSDPEVKERHRVGMKIGNARPESKARRSEAAKKSMSDPEVKERHRAASKEAFASPKTKAKRSASQKARAARPDVRSKLKTQCVNMAESNRDTAVYEWFHRDGRAFVGTRLEFQNYSGLTRDQCYPLFRTKPQKAVHGWSVSTSIQSSQTQLKAN